MTASLALLRALVAEAAVPLPGENGKSALWRVADAMGVSHRSVVEWSRGAASVRDSEVEDYCQRAALAVRQRLQAADAAAASARARIAAVRRQTGLRA